MGKYWADRYTPNELRAMSPDDLKWKPNMVTAGDYRGSEMAVVPLGKLEVVVIRKPYARPDVPKYDMIAYDNGDPVPVPGINGNTGDSRSHMDKPDVMRRLAEIAESPMNQPQLGSGGRRY